MPIDVLSLLCAQLTRDLLAIPKFLFSEIWRFNDFQNGGRHPSCIFKICRFCHVTLVEMPFCFQIQNFAEIGQSVDELWPKQRFSRWRPPPSWISKISTFGHVTVMGFNICCSVPNFIKIAQFFTELWWFCDLQNGGRPPSWICYDVTILHRRTHFPLSKYCPEILCWSVLWFQGYLPYRMWPFWLYVTDHGNFGVAHALYHVTFSREVQNNHSYEVFDFYLPIHYATFMRLRWRLRGVLRWASPLLSDFRRKFWGCELAHALYHVTLRWGIQNNHSYEIFDPYLPIHYATFMRLRWRLRGVLREASPLLSDFRLKFSVPSKMVPKMALIWGNRGSKC